MNLVIILAAVTALIISIAIIILVMKKSKDRHLFVKNIAEFSHSEAENVLAVTMIPEQLQFEKSFVKLPDGDAGGVKIEEVLESHR